MDKEGDKEILTQKTSDPVIVEDETSNYKVKSHEKSSAEDTSEAEDESKRRKDTSDIEETEELYGQDFTDAKQCEDVSSVGGMEISHSATNTSDSITPDDIMYEDDEYFRESLKRQVTDELIEISLQNAIESSMKEIEKKEQEELHKRNRRKKIGIILAVSAGVIILLLVGLFATKPGRKVLYRMAGGYIHKATDYVDDTTNTMNVIDNSTDQNGNIQNPQEQETSDTEEITYIPEPRSEDYVKNYLIFGLEEIEQAKNTDTIMLVSINSQDKTIKITSLLRDIYVATDSIKPGKLNSIFATHGASGLVSFIENKFLIKIEGYAYVNFDSFESMINYLGGITLELGAEEARYLNRTNYISKKEYRNVSPGLDHLNGNQVLGYCRIRKVATLGGANDDYGRTLRQRRVIEAIFNSYKSKNLFDLISIGTQCLQHVKTNLTAEQMENIIEMVVENKITKMVTMRVPVNGSYESLTKYNGVYDPLVIDYKANIVEMYQFIYLDTEEEAMVNVTAKLPAVSP